MLRSLRAALGVLALSACSAVVPSTAARLAALDPLTADPAALELVVILPPGLEVNPGSARLALSATRGAEHRAGSFRLADRPVASGLPLPTGATARGFAVAEADVEAMRALQADIAGWQRSGAARGQFGLGIDGCAVGVGPVADARASVLIRVAKDGPFLPLVAEGRLSELLGPEVLRAIKPCQAAE
ncbi:MAG: hypothetical protein ACK4FR_07190 [Tabrizicola sp.]